MSLSSLFPSTPPTHPSAVLTAHRALYNSLLSTQQYQPFVWPYRALGPNLLIAYLLIPPLNTSRRPKLAAASYYARWVVLVTVLWFSGWAIVECRSPMVTVGYGIGLINAWSVLWTATLVVFVDMRRVGRRIEARKKLERKEEADSEITDGHVDGQIPDGLRRRKATEIRRQSPGSAWSSEVRNDTQFVWQGLPSNLWHRIHWVTDLVANFRGIRWSHQVSGVPFPDASSPSAFAKPIPQQSPSPTATSPASPSKPYPSRSSLFRYNVFSFIVTLVALDVVKFIYLKDTYYWGVSNPAPSPFPYPRSTRLIISLAAIYLSLNSIFLLGPLVFGCLVSQRIMGDITWPWLYPPLFGSPMEVCRHGLAGFWGNWWHQMFRYAFEQLGEFIAGPLCWDKKSVKGGILRVLVAFVASGTLHACGSHTTLGDTQPSRAFVFFALQPVGLLAQRAVAGWMKRAGLRERIPARVRGAANLGLVIGWFWLTGPMVADDFARGGIWLYEPLPISPSRGFAGEGWWRWGGTWYSWHSDEKWWKSGLVM